MAASNRFQCGMLGAVYAEPIGVSRPYDRRSERHPKVGLSRDAGPIFKHAPAGSNLTHRSRRNTGLPPESKASSGRCALPFENQTKLSPSGAAGIA